MVGLTPRTEREIYSDFFTNLDKHPIKNTLLRKINVDAVKQSIKNIVLTDRGERLYNPTFGGNIRALLFENKTPQTFISIKEQIKDVLEAHEPRAEIIDIVVADTFDDHTVDVSIVFRVINIQDPITLQIILERVR